MNYTGIAWLNVSQTINVDGKQIVNNTWIGGGVQQRSGYVGRDYTMYTAAHEIGHYLFRSASHIDYATNLCLMSRYPVWNGSRGMHSWEREYLGWITYSDKTTDGSETLADYMTSDEVYRIPISSNEYFLIENRKHYSTHDKAKDTGFYFYKLTSASSYPPAVDVLCADGNWDFQKNTSNHTLTRTTPNVSGKDEMNYNSSGYYCAEPTYHENSAWGDNEDAFDQTFNNVLSPESNPRSTNSGSLEFSIEVTGTNQITFYFDGDGNGDEYEGSPSKPQNLKIAWYGDHPKLTWETNGEPDIQSYKIWKYAAGSSMIAATIPHNSSNSTHSWIDNSVSKPGKFDPRIEYSYKVKAVDSTNKSSLYSNQVSIIGNGFIWKTSDEENDNETEVITKYSLNQNYPNPFNPVTTISYQLPEKGQVILKIYNSLGKEIKELVNSYQGEGNYTVKFDGSDLPSGIYFYKFKSGNFNKVNKMLLLK